MPPTDRRTLLRAGLACGASALARPVLARASAAERSLVLVQLTGGNDGLSLLVPFEDDAYHAARPELALSRDEVTPIADGLGLNGELIRLHRRWEAGELALVQGVGYPQPNRSHFQSYEIWHTADPRGRASGDGWIGRLAAERWPRHDPTRVVHVGSSPPYSLHSRTHPPASFVTPNAYRWAGDERARRAYEAAGREPRRGRRGSELVERVRQTLRDSQRSSAAIRAAATRYAPTVDYPDDAFAWALRDIAALLASDVGSRVFSVELGGFDTHRDQRRRHRNLMHTLDAGLGAFLADIAAHERGRECLVLVFSEFGRRVGENGSKGTDHGTAGPVLALGARVRGGLYGTHPSLTELDAGDLVFTTDFRSVYATVIERWFGAGAERVLGARYEPLEFV